MHRFTSTTANSNGPFLRAVEVVKRVDGLVHDWGIVNYKIRCNSRGRGTGPLDESGKDKGRYELCQQRSRRSSTMSFIPDGGGAECEWWSKRLRKYPCQLLPPPPTTTDPLNFEDSVVPSPSNRTYQPSELEG